MSRSRTFLILTGSTLLTLATGCGGGGGGSDDPGGFCDIDQDCDSWEFCDGGICAPLPFRCQNDNDCDDWETCVNGACVQRIAEPDAEEESADAEEAEETEAPQDPPDIDADPEEIDFGAGRVGVAVERQVWIFNRGEAPLVVQSLQIEQGDKAVFDVSTDSGVPFTVFPTEPRELSVTYTQDDALPDVGSLLIGSNDPDPEEAITSVRLYSSYKGQSALSVVEDPLLTEPEVESLAFGELPVGTADSTTVFLKNSGSGESVLSLDEIRISPRTSTSFTVTSLPMAPAFLYPFDALCVEDDCAARFGEGYTCMDGLCEHTEGTVPDLVKVNVRFQPGVSGNLVSFLIIGNDSDADEGETRVIPLSGSGVVGDIVAAPNPLDFGIQYTGFEYQDTVTVSNAGGDQLTVESMALEDGTGPFSVSTPGGSPWLLAPGETVDVTVTYAPTAAQLAEDQLLIVSDAPGTPEFRVRVVGTGINPPTIQVTPTAHDFGELQPGGRAEVEIDVRNMGGDDLTISELRLDPDHAALSFTPTVLPILAPGEAASVYAVCAPTAVGPVSGVLEIDSNDPNNATAQVTLDAEVFEPDITIEPYPVLDFQDVYYFDETKTAQVTAHNSGTGTLVIEEIKISEGSATDFTLDNVEVGGAAASFPIELTGGATEVTFDVTFDPDAEHSAAGAVEFVTNLEGRGRVYLALAGVARDCLYPAVDRDPGTPGCESTCVIGAEVACDGVDDNCDGEVDEGLSRPCSRRCGDGLEYCTGNGPNDYDNCDAPIELPDFYEHHEFEDTWYDDNDTCAHATFIGTSPTGVYFHATLDTNDDVDYFKFWGRDECSAVPTKRQLIEIYLRELPDNYDLYMYKGLSNCNSGTAIPNAGDNIGSSTNSGTAIEKVEYHEVYDCDTDIFSFPTGDPWRGDASSGGCTNWTDPGHADHRCYDSDYYYLKVVRGSGGSSSCLEEYKLDIEWGLTQEH